MTERPILFSSPMVRAILEGRKTMTRRVVKPQPPRVEDVRSKAGIDFSIFTDDLAPGKFRVGGPVWAVRDLMGVKSPEWVCPYGKPGDRLWVRERFQWLWATDEKPRSKDSPEGWKISYPATDGIQEYLDHSEGVLQRCAPSIHMPRWASRLTLEITKVRVERVLEISEADCIAEGCNGGHYSIPNYPFSATPREHFRHVWDKIYGAGGMDSNPWVWVTDFRRVNAS